VNVACLLDGKTREEAGPAPETAPF
jgi:hypothetical protein